MTEIKDTLEKMLLAEKQAAGIVKQADEQARTTVEHAHRQASEVLAKAREEAHRQAVRIVEEALDSARKEKAAQLDAVRQKLKGLPAQIPAERRRAAADLIVKSILGDA